MESSSSKPQLTSAQKFAVIFNYATSVFLVLSGLGLMIFSVYIKERFSSAFIEGVFGKNFHWIVYVLGLILIALGGGAYYFTNHLRNRMASFNTIVNTIGNNEFLKIRAKYNRPMYGGITLVLLGAIFSNFPSQTYLGLTLFVSGMIFVSYSAKKIKKEVMLESQKERYGVRETYNKNL